MKSQINIHSPAARPFVRLAEAASFALALFVSGTTVSMAQVQAITVNKIHAYAQTSATSVALETYSGNFGFGADVDGQNISAITAPTVAGPINAAALGSLHNGGRLVYSTQDKGWRYGSPSASDYGASSLGILDANFGSGTYTMTVNGVSVPLLLTGDAYPNVPVMTLSGGAWVNGKYEIDVGRSLTITTNAFTAYGTHADDFICVVVMGDGFVKPFNEVAPFGCGWTQARQFSSAVPGKNTLTYTLPANSLVAGKEYGAGIFFGAMVDVRPNAALPGSVNAAYYGRFTSATIKAVATVLPAVTPTFPMTVTSNITASTATATAAIQYRPQDIGTTGSVYVFAVAPANLVKGGFEEKAVHVGTAWSLEKADPPATCVLAQLSSTGQLTAVTYAQLQAYTSGTLSANGASVTILNNASTPTVAGATFYVGYGASSTAMITNGVYRNAVTVPGTSVCPMLSSQTALWWNPAENGWGVNFAHQGNILFGTLYTYDAAGAPLWLMMSNGAMQGDGVTFTGDLYRTTGPAFNANPFTPITEANLTKVGTMTASFVDANSGTLSYTVNGATVNKAIQRLVYGTRAANCLPSTASRTASTNYQDLWWNAAESGWGVNVTHQDNTLFATLFDYDATGKGLWLVMSGGVRQADGSYQGTLYRSSGPAFNASPFTPITEANLANVGTMRFQFTDGERGTLNYTYNGAPVTKAITRLVFSNPVPACN